MEINILYEDEDVLVADKPAGIIGFPEGIINKSEQTLIDCLLEKYPKLKQAGEQPRYGIVHRLDKDTSGILLIAKNDKTLDFLQKQFKTEKVIKEYTTLVIGKPQKKEGVVETLIGRSGKERKKQKAYLPFEPEAQRKGLRKAITGYSILEQFKDYALLRIMPRTGRKHQIRCHLAYLGCPVAGDRIYGFKNQACPRGLKRQFLHAGYLKTQLPNGENKSFRSKLPEELKIILEKLNSDD